MKSGYFLAFRSVWRHPAFKNLIESAIWLYIVSNASHKDKELKFMENPVFVKRSELIFPIRKNASIWKMPYSSMRAFIQRLRRSTTLIMSTDSHMPQRKKWRKRCRTPETLRFQANSYNQMTQSRLRSICKIERFMISSDTSEPEHLRRIPQ